MTRSGKIGAPQRLTVETGPRRVGQSRGDTSIPSLPYLQFSRQTWEFSMALLDGPFRLGFAVDSFRITRPGTQNFVYVIATKLQAGRSATGSLLVRYGRADMHRPSCNAVLDARDGSPLIEALSALNDKIVRSSQVVLLGSWR